MPKSKHRCCITTNKQPYNNSETTLHFTIQQRRAATKLNVFHGLLRMGLGNSIPVEIWRDLNRPLFLFYLAL